MFKINNIFTRFNVIVASIVFIITAIVAGFYVYNQFGTGKGELIGGQKDEHGCLVAAGYQWCETSQKCLRSWEEFCPSIEQDRVIDLMQSLPQETNIAFSEPQQVSFNWLLETEAGVDEVEVHGLISKVEAVEDRDLITTFFEDEGFDIDAYNYIEGTFGNLTGYKSGNTVCTAAAIIAGLDKKLPESIGIHDIEIKCGALDPSKEQITN